MLKLEAHSGYHNLSQANQKRDANARSSREYQTIELELTTYDTTAAHVGAPSVPVNSALEGAGVDQLFLRFIGDAGPAAAAVDIGHSAIFDSLV